MKRKVRDFLIKLNTTKLGILIVVIAVVIGAGFLSMSAILSPNVNVEGEQIRIAGIYGQRISFNDIEEISLLEMSMEDMGIVTRERLVGMSGMRGFNIFSYYRGNFTRRYIFAQVSSGPTIRITRIGKAPIYLNLRNGDATRELYQNLLNSWQGE